MRRELTEYPRNTVGILVAPQFSERAKRLASSSVCNIILTEATDIASNIIQYVESLEDYQEYDSEEDEQYKIFVMTKPQSTQNATEWLYKVMFVVTILCLLTSVQLLLIVYKSSLSKTNTSS